MTYLPIRRDCERVTAHLLYLPVKYVAQSPRTRNKLFSIAEMTPFSNGDAVRIFDGEYEGRSGAIVVRNECHRFSHLETKMMKRSR
jgi:hypothetical protein